MDTARQAHYGDFYRAIHPEPVAVVWGNCQAEAVRVLLAASPSFPIRTVRIPPVHELGPADMAPLQRLLPHTSLLVSQPVRPGYRDLPLGTLQVASALRRGATVLRWPVVRYVGLHPFSAIVRHPADPSLNPPLVPYHDLRTLSRSAGRRPRRPPGPEALRSVAASSVAELAKREHLGTDVAVSDLLMPLGAQAAHTLNHPGNRLLLGLVHRIQEKLCLPADAADPGRTLLGAISAPLEDPVIAALGLDADPTQRWTVAGRRIDPGEVTEAHTRWYGQHPSAVTEGLRRHAERLAVLGL